MLDNVVSHVSKSSQNVKKSLNVLVECATCHC